MCLIFFSPAFLIFYCNCMPVRFFGWCSFCFQFTSTLSLSSPSPPPHPLTTTSNGCQTISWGFNTTCVRTESVAVSVTAVSSDSYSDEYVVIVGLNVFYFFLFLISFFSFFHTVTVILGSSLWSIQENFYCSF